MDASYYVGLAAAHIRHLLEKDGTSRNDVEKLLEGNTIDNASDDNLLHAALESRSLFEHLYRFKKYEKLLPRVQSVLGVVKSFGVESILDVASQRGALLFPLLHAMDMHALESVTSIDIDPAMVSFLKSVESAPECQRLDFMSLQANMCDMSDFADGSFDCVVCSEILEHLDPADVERAVAETLRVARRIVVCTVPAQPDDNVEHVNLFYHKTAYDPARITRAVQRENQRDLAAVWGRDCGAVKEIKIQHVSDGPIGVLMCIVMKNALD